MGKMFSVLRAMAAYEQRSDDDEAMPSPEGDEVSTACADGQHPDCTGYTDSGQDRCACGCHDGSVYWDGEKWVRSA